MYYVHGAYNTVQTAQCSQFLCVHGPKIGTAFEINGQRLEVVLQAGYISQKYTLENYFGKIYFGSKKLGDGGNFLGDGGNLLGDGGYLLGDGEHPGSSMQLFK